MQLINLLNIEIKALRLFGHCALVNVSNNNQQQWFIFRWYLCLIQFIGMCLYIFLKTKLIQYEFALKPDLSNSVEAINFIKKHIQKDSSDADQILSLTLMIIYDTYTTNAWIAMVINRFLNRRRYGDVYNCLLVIDQDLNRLQQHSGYVNKVARRYFCRWTIFILIQVMFTFDEFAAYSFKTTYTEKFHGCFLKHLWFLTFDQQITVYEIIQIQSETVSKALKTLKTLNTAEKQMRTHKLVLNIVHTKKLLDKTFNAQFIADIFGCSIFLISLLYWETIVIEGGTKFSKNDAVNAFVSERTFIYYLCWILYNFDSHHKTKRSIEEMVAQFSKSSKKSNKSIEPCSDTYSLINFGRIKHNFMSTQRFIYKADRKFIFKVSYSSKVCSVISKAI